MHRIVKNVISAVLLVTLSVAIAATPASAKVIAVPAAAVQLATVYTITEAGLQFEVPKGWKVVRDGQNVVASVEDGAVSVTFVVEDDYAGTVKGMKQGLSEKLTGLKSDGASQQDTHNGMTHIEESGTGMLKGVEIRWSIDVLKAGKPVTILTFGVAKILEAHNDDYGKLVNSLKKI